ncbi:MAG: LCP family protein [Clostridiales bacterium]|jgi:LCP family protein required for cell wall assembly|nr:LCP family protein [Clostridiales bacterium]
MRNNKKKFISETFFVIFSMVSVFAGVRLANKIKYESIGQSIEIEMDKPKNIGFVNALVMGLDGNGARTDSIMFMSFNGYKKKLNIISIPRDTRVLIGKKFQKINAALEIGKQEVKKGKINDPQELMIKKVKEIIGLQIHYFASVDFKGFRNIVDILEGIDFDVPDIEGNGKGMNYNDSYQNLKIHLKPGFQHLNGEQAEGLVRYRRGYIDADLGRIKIQQNFVREFAKQKLKPKYLTIIKKLYEEAKENVQTNYTLFDLVKHIPMIKKFNPEDISSFQVPGKSVFVEGVWYFIPDLKETRKIINENFR